MVTKWMRKGKNPNWAIVIALLGLLLMSVLVVLDEVDRLLPCAFFIIALTGLVAAVSDRDDAQEDDAQEDDAQEDGAQEDGAQEDGAQEDGAQEDDAHDASLTSDQ